MTTMDLQVSGPEQIRVAFTTAIATTDQHAVDLAGVAGVLDTAAGQFETREMAATTLGHLRDGAAAVTTAAAAVTTAGERLQAALDDFNTRDGHVADPVAQVGNLMQAEGYTTTFATSGGQEQTMTYPAGSPSATGKDTAATPRPASRSAAGDKLRMATKMRLGADESVAASGSIRDTEDTCFLLASVTGPSGLRVYVGCGIPADDRLSWRGADGGSTVVLNTAGATLLQNGIATITQDVATTAQEFKQLEKDEYRLWEQRCELEKLRYPHDPAAGEDRVQLDTDLREARQEQQVRLNSLNRSVDRLSPQKRADYDRLEAERLATTEREARGDLRIRQAALLYGLTAHDMRELVELEKNSSRLDEAQRERMLTLSFNDTPDLRFENGTPQRIAAFKAEMKARERFRDEVGPLDALDADIARLEVQIADMDASAATLDPAIEARRQQVVTAHTTMADQYRGTAGQPLNTVEIPGDWGTLVLQAVQRDYDIPAFYRMQVRPPDADSEWLPGDEGEGIYSPSAAQLRKLSALLDDVVTAGRTQQDGGA